MCLYFLNFAPALAQQAVLIRAWEQPKIAQISFDWKRNIDFITKLEGNKVTITFSEPFIANFAPIQRLAPSYFSGGKLSDDNKTGVLVLKRNASIIAYQRNNRVILEVTPNDDNSPTTIENKGDNYRRVGSALNSSNTDGGVMTPEMASNANISGVPSSRNVSSSQQRPVISNVSVEVEEIAEGVTELRFNWPFPVTYNFTNISNNLDLRFNQRANIDRAKLVEALPKWLRTPVISNAKSGTSLILKLTEPKTIAHERIFNQIVLRFTQPGEGAAKNFDDLNRPGRAGRPPTTDEIATARQVLTGGLETKGMTMEEARDILVAAGEVDPNSLELTEDSDLEIAENITGATLVFLRFDWPGMVGGAIFRRGEYIWIVFDEPAPIDMEPLRGESQDVIVNIEQLSLKGTTILRLLVPDININPALRREGNSWLVDLRTGPTLPSTDLTIDIGINNDVGPHIIFPSQEPGEYLRITDPSAGDIIDIITYREVGYGVKGLRKYPEISILPSAQGVAIVPVHENLYYVRADDGYTITAPDGGLALSGVSPNSGIEANVGFNTASLFNFKEWARGPPEDFLKNRQELSRTLAELPLEDVARARLYLARFYVAHGLGHEAMGVLEIIANDHPKLIESDPVLALRGAANLLSGRLEQAEEDLSHKSLDSYRDVNLWRGVLLAEQGKMREANQYFRLASSQLRNYPYPLKGRLGILMAEAAMENRNLRLATNLIEQMDREKEQMTRGMMGDLNYHKARMMASRTDYELANQIWSKLIKSRDRKNAARSTLAYVNVGLKQDLMSEEEALQHLENLRYKWRGDQFELNVLDQLGNMYIKNGLYGEGFDAYKTALSYFPNDPITKVISNRMEEVFRDLFLHGKSEEMDAAKALAFYDSYRELTPPGSDGDIMIKKLADRLIQVDLLDRAARLLDYQIEYRLQGEPRMKTGTKLAMIRLLENKPDLTIQALDKSRDVSVTGPIVDDRRRLRAQAQFAMGEHGEAIKLLAGDVSHDANLLRKNIFWKRKNWGEAAKNLQRLAGKPPARNRQVMPEDRAKYVIDWAVALKLDRDLRGLDYLREVYGKAMAKTEVGEIFDYLTLKNTDKVSLDKREDIEAYIEKLTARSKFDDFLDSYKEEIF